MHAVCYVAAAGKAALTSRLLRALLPEPELPELLLEKIKKAAWRRHLVTTFVKRAGARGEGAAHGGPGQHRQEAAFPDSHSHLRKGTWSNPHNNPPRYVSVKPRGRQEQEGLAKAVPSQSGTEMGCKPGRSPPRHNPCSQGEFCLKLRLRAARQTGVGGPLRSCCVLCQSRSRWARSPEVR